MIWTAKQKMIFDELQKGNPPAQIHKEHKIAYQSITKVKNAIAKGESPTGETPKQLPPAKNKPVTTTPPGDDQSKVGKQTPKELDAATLAKLVPTVAYMQLTPIMVGAKSFMVRELGWSADVKWEDIIDTVFYKYFKGAYQVLLQGYTKLEKKAEVSPKTAWEGGAGSNGDGSKQIDIDSPQFKELCTTVTKQLVELAQAGKLGQPVGS